MLSQFQNFMLHVPIDNFKKNARHKYRHLRCMTLNGDLYKSKAYDKTEHPMVQYVSRFSFSLLCGTSFSYS